MKSVRAVKKPQQKRRSLTPRLKPGQYTALSVLKFVHDRIAEEPKRLFMDNWVAMLSGKKMVGASPRFRSSMVADCGTAACVAGWIGLVTRQKDIVKWEGEHLAYEGLGLTNGYDPTQARLMGELRGIFYKTKYPKQRVIWMLDDFINRNQTELLNYKVEVKA